MAETIDVEDWLLDPPDVPADELFGIASNALRLVGAAAGVHPRRQVLQWLNEGCRRLVAEALGLARELEPGALLRGLVLANEALRMLHAGLHMAVRGDVTTAELTRRAREELPYAALRAGSLRFAVEMHSAMPPCGGRAPTRAELRRLWTYAFAIVELGATSDLVHLGLLEARVQEDSAGRLQIGRDPGLETRLSEHGSAVADEQTDPFRQALGVLDRREMLTAAEARTEQELNARLDAAFADYAGVTLADLSHLIGFLASQAGFQPFDALSNVSPGGFNTARESELAPVIGACLSIGDANVRRALRFLSIGPVASFPEKQHMPWVYGRARAFQARPIVRHPDGDTLSWSGMHTYLALDLLGSQLTYASLPGPRKEHPLYGAMHAVSAFRGSVFESQLEGLFRSDLRLRARRVAKLGSHRITKPDGNPLGDVDVLVADSESCTLAALEAKAIAAAATPSEHVRDIERFTATGTDRTDMDRHLMRIDFVERHKAEALQTLGLDHRRSERWRVTGAIVTQLPSLAGGSGRRPIPVVSMRDLRDIDLVEWIRALA